MKLLKNQQGSTLMLVVITVAILSILGTALLSMSLMNINMKYNDKRVKTSQYYAEANIDQIYTFIGNVVADEIDNAINQTSAEIDAVVQNYNQLADEGPDFLGINLNDLSGSGSPYLKCAPYVYFSEDGYPLLDMDLIEEDSKSWYIDAFKTNINSHDDDLQPDLKFINMINEAKDDGVLLDLNIDEGGSSVFEITIGDADQDGTIIEPTPFTIGTTPDEFILHQVRVDYTDTTGTVKSIVTDIVISDQVTDFPISTVENRMVVADNPLWQKAIVADEYIQFNNGNINILGDIYGYATTARFGGSILDLDEMKGVTAANGADLSIDGDIFSRGNVQVENSGSSITVNNGRVYGSGLVTQDGSNGSIIVNGNVYTTDDIELNGNGSSITINGSYYGFYDGSLTNNALAHDISSAIVINEDMANESLTITGTQVLGDDKKEDYSGVLIAGTSYVNTQPARYQTGESVSIRGNYLVYAHSWLANALEIEAMKASPTDFISGSERYNFYANASTRDDAVDLLDDVEMNVPVGVTGINFANLSTVKDKMLYFAAYDKYIDITGDILNSGENRIDIKNYLYTTGLGLNGNQFEYRINPDFGIPEFNELEEDIIVDYVYQMNQLREAEGALPLQEIDVINSNEVSQNAFQYYNTTYDINDFNVVEKYSQIETLAGSSGIYTQEGIGSIFDLGDATDVIMVNYEEGRDIIIWDSSLAAIPAPSDYNALFGTPNIMLFDIQSVSEPGRLQGIIISNGGIQIHCAIDYAGALIARKQIETYANGTINLYNNDSDITSHLQDMIYTDSRAGIDELFDVSYYGSPLSDTVVLGNYEKVSIVEGDYVDDSRTNSIYDYRDLVYFRHWKVLR